MRLRAAEDDAAALRDQLSTLQDKWMALEEWSVDAKRRLRTLTGAESGDELADGPSPRASGAVVVSDGSASGGGGPATVASIESLYREKNHALHRELKDLKRATKEAKVQYESQLKRAVKKIESHKAKARAATEEAEQLRERAFELQSQLERGAPEQPPPAAVAAAAVDTFDAEGQFQLLYKETLLALNEERDARHKIAVSTRTEVQNLREELDDAREEAMGLRADVEVRRLREASLSSAYDNELRIERDKERQMELLVGTLKAELAQLRDQSAALKRVGELEAELEVTHTHSASVPSGLGARGLCVCIAHSYRRALTHRGCVA